MAYVSSRAEPAIEKTCFACMGVACMYNSGTQTAKKEAFPVGFLRVPFTDTINTGLLIRDKCTSLGKIYIFL